jgi:hypothetical protein
MRKGKWILSRNSSVKCLNCGRTSEAKKVSFIGPGTTVVGCSVCKSEVGKIRIEENGKCYYSPSYDPTTKFYIDDAHEAAPC